MVYRIAKWDEVFENAESRRLKTLTWVAWPVDLDSTGYMLMVEKFGDDTPTIYGAWAALVSIAAKCPVRGTIADSKGRGYSLSRLALKSHMPAKVFEQLIAWASTKEVAWLELTNDPGNQRGSPDESQKILGTPETDREGNDLRPSVRPSACARENGVIVLNESHWPDIERLAQSVTRVVTRNQDARLERLKAADRRLALRAAALALGRYGADWLNGILESISARTEPIPAPWGYFRGALIIATQEQFNENFREAEKLVKQAPKTVERQA